MRFAIITSARSGSSHLINLLNSRADILCNGEICHQNEVYVNWGKRHRTPEALAELTALRTADAGQFLERIFAMNLGAAHVGFKILRGQQKNVFRAIMEDRTIKKIFLFRRNVLANYSSKLIAIETGQYHLNSKMPPAESGTRIKVFFDAEAFIAHRRKYEQYYASAMDALLQSGQNFHLVNYEEINNSCFFRSLLAYIGADLSAPLDVGKYVKQNPSDILSRFSNSGQAEAFLRENNLTHWSYEGQVRFDVEDGEQRGRRRQSDSNGRSDISPEGAISENV